MSAAFTVVQTAAFREWLDDLSDRVAAKLITRRVQRLKEAGHLGDAKSVGEGVVELRVHFGPGYRIYLTRRGSEIVVLLCAGTKGTQSRDIAQAVALAKEWL